MLVFRVSRQSYAGRIESNGVPQGPTLRTRHPSIDADVLKAVQQWPGASIDDLQQLLPYHASYSELYSLVEASGERSTRGSSAGLSVFYAGRRLHVFSAKIARDVQELAHVLVDDQYRAIIRFLSKNPLSLRQEIQNAPGVTLSREGVRNRLNSLMAGGQVESDPQPTNTDPKTRYRLTPKMVRCVELPEFRDIFMGENVKTPESFRRPC